MKELRHVIEDMQWALNLSRGKTPNTITDPKAFWESMVERWMAKLETHRLRLDTCGKDVPPEVPNSEPRRTPPAPPTVPPMPAVKPDASNIDVAMLPMPELWSVLMESSSVSMVKAEISTDATITTYYVPETKSWKLEFRLAGKTVFSFCLA